MNAMNAQIINGKEYSASMRIKLRQQAEEFEQKSGRKVGLAVVLVGENPASAVYVRNKIKACQETNVRSYSYYLPQETSQDELMQVIDTLNKDVNIDGILVQLPLPKHISESEVLASVNYKKDVDGFHAINAGNLMLGNACLAACTPSGIIELIKSTGVDIAGKNAVVIGRSNIVGKPVAMLLLANNATVTITHSKTINLPEITRQADILVVAIGKKEFVTANMVKKGAIVIDVGMNRDDGKLYGDVAFDEVSKVASFITPVPGGVGPMTITMLIANAIKAANFGR